MEVDILDDPAIVQPIFNELRKNLSLNIAQSLDQREKALKRLVEGYEAMKPEFEAALKADLGYNAYLSNFAAHSVTLGEINDLINNFRTWAQPRPVKTPIGTTTKIQLLALHLARYNQNHWDLP